MEADRFLSAIFACSPAKASAPLRSFRVWFRSRIPTTPTARPVDVNALVSGLMEFRDPEWKTLGLRVQNRLATRSLPW